MEKKKAPNLSLEDEGAGFRKLFVLLINEPGQCLCECVCVRVCACVRVVHEYLGEVKRNDVVGGRRQTAYWIIKMISEVLTSDKVFPLLMHNQWNDDEHKCVGFEKSSSLTFILRKWMFFS